MNSSSEKLLEILRRLDYDSASGEVYMNSPYCISTMFYPFNGPLYNEWKTVEEFFDKICGALRDKLDVVRMELELYSQASIAAEENLDAAVREINAKANEILKSFDLI